MNKSELIEAIAESIGLEKELTHKALTGFQNVVAETLSKGGTITLPGFGTFSVKERTARTGRHPRTGMPLDIPASRAAHFKAGRHLKDAINDK